MVALGRRGKGGKNVVRVILNAKKNSRWAKTVGYFPSKTLKNKHNYLNRRRTNLIKDLACF
jgi:hypothetical protein